MSAAHDTHDDTHEAGPAEPPKPIGSSDLARTLFFAFLGVIAARFIPGALPLVIATFVAALMPNDLLAGKKNPMTRVAMGAMAFALTLFVQRNWPGTEYPETAKEFPALLSWLIALPILGGLFVLFIPRQSHTLLRGFTLVTMLSVLGASLLLLKVPMGSTYHFEQDIPWVAAAGVHYHVALDGISLWLVLLTTFIVPIATYVSFGSIGSRLKDWCFALLLLEGAMVGTFVSMDLLLFYVFFELGLVPMYVMIGVWGGANRIKSAIKFFLYTMFGSVLMLAAILYMGYEYKQLSGQASFDFFELQRLVIDHGTQRWLWAAFALAFLIKVPMFPLHTWLPDAHTEAPTAGSMILAAVMLKMGTYGYLRFCVGLFPEAALEWAPTLGGIAVLGGILYGALVAWRQEDMKRLVAYSSVAHLGYVMLGVFSMSSAGIEGAVLQMVNHGISTGLLFLLVGVVYDQRHTRHIDDYGGIAKPMPLYAALFVVATMASVGLPATNGFVGEFMIISGVFSSSKLHANSIMAVGATIGVILAALYMLSMVQRVFFGPLAKKENKALKDINPRELLAAAPLVAMIFILGLFPKVFLEPMHSACNRTIADFENRIQANPPPREPGTNTGFYRGPNKLTDRLASAPARITANTDTANSDKTDSKKPEGH
jgi:NADH-quinone oxidoreductase subunit M